MQTTRNARKLASSCSNTNFASYHRYLCDVVCDLLRSCGVAKWLPLDFNGLFLYSEVHLRYGF